MREWAAWWRVDRGSAAAEVTIAAPCLAALLVFVAVVVHRGVDARVRLGDAAHQAARAASIERTSYGATHMARTTATSALTDAGVVCASMNVLTETDGMTPGGTVTVTVTCTVELGDALMLGVPGEKRLSATAAEPIDTWRSEATENTSGDGEGS